MTVFQETLFDLSCYKINGSQLTDWLNWVDGLLIIAFKTCPSFSSQKLVPKRHVVRETRFYHGKNLPVDCLWYKWVAP